MLLSVALLTAMACSSGESDGNAGTASAAGMGAGVSASMAGTVATGGGMGAAAGSLGMSGAGGTMAGTVIAGVGGNAAGMTAAGAGGTTAGMPMSGVGGAAAGSMAGAGGNAAGMAASGDGGNAAGMAASGSGAGMGAGSGGASPSPGCGSGAPESGRFNIDVNGMTREYILAVPANYDASHPYPVIFAWHPLGGSAQQVAGMGPGGYYGLQGETSGEAILVSPEGLVFSGFGGNSLGWANTDGRDVAFFEAMLERFRTEMCVDDSRIFSTGFSFGGMMSYALGCAKAGVVRAIAPMAGNLMGSGCANGTGAIAMMGFHGAVDDFVLTADGRTARDVFVDRNQCTSQTVDAPVYCDDVSQNSQPCTCVSYEGCTDGYPVIWCEFNGGHQPAPNSAAAIWDFFSQF